MLRRMFTIASAVSLLGWNAAVRRFAWIVTITLAALLGILLVVVPVAACIWDLSWDRPPPDFYVKITATTIETSHTDFPYVVAAMMVGVFTLPLCCWALSVTRPSVGPRSCHICSYDLTGNVSGICPECGAAVARATSASPPSV